MQHPTKTIYEQLGSEAFERLIAAFYAGVKADLILQPLYPAHDMQGAERRLRLFLMQYFGGPATYSQERGHPRLRARHMPFAIGAAERDAWLRNMDAALDAAAIPEPVRSQMREYFQMAADFMINVDAPDGGIVRGLRP
jgi:hemoglobin